MFASTVSDDCVYNLTSCLFYFIFVCKNTIFPAKKNKRWSTSTFHFIVVLLNSLFNSSSCCHYQWIWSGVSQTSHTSVPSQWLVWPLTSSDWLWLSFFFLGGVCQLLSSLCLLFQETLKGLNLRKKKRKVQQKSACVQTLFSLAGCLRVNVQVRRLFI